MLVSLPFVLWFVGSIGWLFYKGIGIWGVNSTVVWGVAIANYVWWIGIGNAGTLISSMLLLTRQQWRGSINRFAEAMTLFAVAIAGIMPIMHVGRPLYAYWLAPYPNTMALWPQWRSALVWDFWAIVSYLLFSILFWYVGLIPDLATMRDRTRTRAGQLLYGAFALGWRGSARHWKRLKTLHTTMAALGVPLVCSVHSIVGLDFAASLMPGWQESIFPPYFVVGAMYSGFAMVVVLALAIRWGLNLQAIITANHFEVMGRILLMASIVMGYSYATEWFMAWYGGQHSERSLVVFRIYRDLCAAVLGAAALQRGAAAGAVVSGRAPLAAGPVRDLHRHQYRDVAGADPDHLEHAVARLYAEPMAQLPLHILGLVVPDRAAWPVCFPVPDFCSPGAGSIDVRHARACHKEGAA